MIYRIVHRMEQTKQFIVPSTKCGIWYFSKKELIEIYRHNNFHVIGEIGGFSFVPKSGDVLISENGTEIPILPRGSLIRPFEWIVGYAELENGSYLAVVCSLLLW